MVNSSIHGERVKSDILAAGVLLWRHDASKVTARGIGQQLGLTHAGVLYHFGSTEKLRNAVAEHAIRTGDPIVVPHLIVTNHPATISLSAQERRRFLNSV